MAASGKSRIDKRAAWNDSIKTTLIIERLNKQALSDKEIMSPGAITAARILLAKTMPDLKATEHTGDVSVRAVSINF